MIGFGQPFERINLVTPRAVGQSPMILGAYSAFRERLGRQAYPPVIALGLTVAYAYHI